MQSGSNSIVGGCGSTFNVDEYIEEVQSGDKKLTYYKRKQHLYPPSDTSRSVSPSSLLPRYADDRSGNVHNKTWRSEDNILPTYSEAVRSLKEQKEKIAQRWHSAEDAEHSHLTYSPRSYSISPDATEYVAENQFIPEYVVAGREGGEDVDDVSLISSAHSACSFSRRYLDASMDHHKHAAVDCPPSLLEQEARVKSQNVPEGGAIGYEQQQVTSLSNYYVTQSRTCPSSGVISFPFDHNDSHKGGVIKTSANKFGSSALSIETVKRRRQICKYLALFCVLVVAIVCLSSGVLFYYVVFYPQEMHLNQGDMGVLSLPLLFCGEVQANSLSSNLQLQGLSESAGTIHAREVIAGNIEVYPADIWLRDFYLQAGSSAKLSLTSEYAVEALVFNSELQYMDWSKGKSESFLHKLTTIVAGVNEEISLFSDDSSPLTRNFTADLTERYFIVVRNKMDLPHIAHAHMELIFDRVVYNTSGAVQGCTSSPGEWCSISSHFTNQGLVVVGVPVSHGMYTIPQSSEITYRCTPRVWLFVLVFFCSFLLCLIFIACGYGLVMRFCLFCCVGEEEKGMSTEFLYLNKHTINNLQGHRNNNAAPVDVRTVAKPAETTNLNHFDPVVVETTHVDDPSMERVQRSVQSSQASRYHFDASSQSVCMDPEASRREEIMQMQELQLQQFKSRELQRQQHEVEITNGPPIKQLLTPDSVPHGNQRYFVHPYMSRTTLNSQDNLGYEESSPDKNMSGSRVGDVYRSHERDIIQIASSEDGDIPPDGAVCSDDEELYQCALRYPDVGRQSESGSAELFV